MSASKPVYSVVIPVYNSGAILTELTERLIKVFDQEMGEPFEVIFVDDLSPDHSWAVLESLHRKDNRIKAVQLMDNTGQHTATMCGFTYVRGDYAITMDDDLQHLPEEIPHLVKAIKNNEKADIIIGSYISKRHNLIRNLGTKLFNRLTSSLFKKPLDLKMTSFRIMNRQVVDALVTMRVDNPRIGYLLLMITKRIYNTPVQHAERKAGRSGYNFKRVFKDSVENVLSYSSLPLRMMIFLGFISAVICFILSFYYLYRYLFIGIAVPGWTTVILLLLFFFGITLFSIGLVGEYLIRIIRETKKYPQYTVRKELS